MGSSDIGSDQSDAQPPAPSIAARPQGTAKRAMDLCVTLSLLPFALVVLAPFVIALKLTAPGPILFRQTRYGYKKQRFEILKLRTMTVNENDDAFRQVVQGDARITKVGAILRRTSLDEVPQLLNVIRGDMSLVGPRPHPTKLDDVHAPLIAHYNDRFLVRPGVTGLAQVRGHRGPTPSTEVMAARIESDLEYAATASFWLDLKIVLRTARVLLRPKNAI